MKKKLISTSLVITVFICCFNLATFLSSQANGQTTSLNDITTNNNLNSVTSWNMTTTVLVSSESADSAYDPDITVDKQGNVHVIWVDSSDNFGDSYQDILYKYWNGTNWSNSIVVTDEINNLHYDPRIVIDSTGTLHAVWTKQHSGYDIQYSSKKNPTSDWTDPINLTEDISAFRNVYPDIAVDNQDNIHIVWLCNETSGNPVSGNISYIRRDSETGLWSDIEWVSSWEESIDPKIAVDSEGSAHIVWREGYDYFDSSGSDSDIGYRKWDAKTGDWAGSAEVVSDGDTGSVDPSIAIDSSDIPHVVWKEYLSETQIVYSKWLPGTSEWSSPHNVSSGMTGVSPWSGPDMEIDFADNIHVTWEDSTPDFDGSGASDYDIFYSFFNTTTSTWSTPSLISDVNDDGDNDEDSQSPAIATDDLGQVYIVWDDLEDYGGEGESEEDIFYRALGEVPSTPSLKTITPNPDIDGDIVLDWEETSGTRHYYVYRGNGNFSASNITDMTPIAVTSNTFYNDYLNNDSTYFYAIIAGNLLYNSTLSNVEAVEVILGGEDTYPQMISGIPDEMIIIVLGLIVVVLGGIIVILLIKR